MKRVLLLAVIILVLTSCNANALDASSIEPPQQEIPDEIPAASVAQAYKPEELAEPEELEVVSSEAETNTPNTQEHKNDPDEWLTEGAVYCEPGVDYQKGLKHPLIAVVPRLHPVASEFMSLDGEAFADKYEDLNKLYNQGVQYKRKVYIQYYYDMLDTIRFGENCKTEVIDGLHVGASVARMRELFGEPHFSNDELKLSGYRFSDFYLICVGKNEITEISITKYRHLPDEYQSFVSDYMSGKMPVTFGAIFELVELYPQNIYHYPGGFGMTLLYDNGIELVQAHDGSSFLVWNNYEGEILTDTPNTLQFMDEDMYFYFMSSFYRREQTIFERKDGVYSPDGNIAAFSCNAGRPVEGDQIYIRWRDGSHCDINLITRHSQSDLLWLNNRYLLFNVLNFEPVLFDTLQNKDYPLREAAGIPPTDRHNDVAYVKADGNKLILYDGQQYIISYSFDKDGNISFQTQLSE